MIHEIDFEVIASLDDFFYSEKFISLAVGPVGSTKTTAGIMKILHHAAEWPHVRTEYGVLGPFGCEIPENSCEIRQFLTF